MEAIFKNGFLQTEIAGGKNFRYDNGEYKNVNIFLRAFLKHKFVVLEYCLQNIPYFASPLHFVPTAKNVQDGSSSSSFLYPKMLLSSSARGEAENDLSSMDIWASVVAVVQIQA